MARRDSSRSGRRPGYVVSILINAVLLYAINAWPGWRTVPFLTSDTPQVLGLVNASLIVSLVANVVFLAADRPAVRALGELAVLGVGLAATFRIWGIFPFDFGRGTFDWALVVRVLLVIGIVGSIIGLVIEFALFIRALAGFDRRVARTKS